MNKTGLVCVQRSCNHHHTYRLSLGSKFDENKLTCCIHLCYLLKCKPIRPLSVQNLPPCENTLQLVRNAQLAAGAGGGVWSKPPEKCRCCYCRRSDRRRSAADAGAEQSSTGRVVDTWWWNHQPPPKSTKIWSRLNSHLLRSARLTGAGESASGADEVIWCKRCCTCVLQLIVVSNSSSPTDLVWVIWQ